MSGCCDAAGQPGCGRSDRDGDLSFDTQVAVALAVADAVRADRFALFGASQGGRTRRTSGAKLGVRSRAQIAAWVTERRLTSGYPAPRRGFTPTEARPER
jgi:pimeloyl-ACP methyl ester carboxylesterase